MKYTFQIITALTAFLVGIAAVLFWAEFPVLPYLPTSEQELSLIPPVHLERKVDFRFSECAGKRSVFLLENLTEHPIYARVQRADHWKEFKEANIELGVHLIHYKAPDAQKFENISPRWDAPEPFKMITPYERIRYGVDLWKGAGEYKVSVPYMEDAEVARRLNEDFASTLKQDFERVKSSWKIVASDTISNKCQ